MITGNHLCPECQDRGESRDVDSGTQKIVLQACLQILHKYQTTERDRRSFTKNDESNRGWNKAQRETGS